MSEELVHVDGTALLVGGGKVKATDIARFHGRASICIAADGGAVALLGAGIVPDLVMGDLDSLPDVARAQISADRLRHITEQDSTDFEKCLSRIRAPLTLGLGFLGRRLDHSLAALSVLARLDAACVLVGSHDVVAHVPVHLTLELEPGTRVSLFPMAEVTGRSQGLEWPIDGLKLSPGGQIGTSNAATGSVTLEMDGAGCLILLPRRALPVLIDGLTA